MGFGPSASAVPPKYAIFMRWEILSETAGFLGVMVSKSDEVSSHEVDSSALPGIWAWESRGEGYMF